MSNSSPERFYRYETLTTVSMHDDIGKILFPYTRLTLQEYSLVKETPKGYWICYGNPFGLKSKDKWVSKTSKKRFAFPTKEEALNNFILRKKRRLKFLENDVFNCKKEIDLGESELKKLT